MCLVVQSVRQLIMQSVQIVTVSFLVALLTWTLKGECLFPGLLL